MAYATSVDTIYYYYSMVTCPSEAFDRNDIYFTTMEEILEVVNVSDWYQRWFTSGYDRSMYFTDAILLGTFCDICVKKMEEKQNNLSADYFEFVHSVFLGPLNELIFGYSYEAEEEDEDEEDN